jgi:hypothetical protein
MRYRRLIARAIVVTIVFGACWTAACSTDPANTSPADADGASPITPPADDAAALDAAALDAAALDAAPLLDAAPPTEPGTAQWAKHFVESGKAFATAVAADKTGNVFIAGNFTGTVNFAGTGPSGVEALTSATNAGFLAKLGPAGQHLWSKKWVSTGNGVNSLSMTTDPSGNVLFAGQTLGSVSFGGAPLVLPGSGSAFVAKLDANGNHLWSRGFDGGLSMSYSLALDTGGDVVVGGYFFSTMNLAAPADAGAPTLTSAGGPDYFLTKLAGNDGHHLWSHSYGDTFGQQLIQVAVDTKNTITVTGATFGSANFGGGPVGSNGTGAGFIAHLDSAGGHLWSKTLAGAAPRTIKAATSDDIVYAGTFVGTVDLSGTGTAGSNTVTSTAANLSDVFLTKLAPTGAHTWSRSFGGATSQYAEGATVDSSGRITMVGRFAKTPLAFSAGGVTAAPLTCAGDQNVYVASFDAAGAHRWSFCAGTAGDTTQSVAIASDPSGNVFAVGDYTTAPSVALPRPAGGQVVLPRNGTTDFFLVKLSP